MSPVEPGARSKAITRCLGLSNGGIPRVDRLTGRWCKGDKLLLCSDGLSDELTDRGIEEIIAEHRQEPDQATADALVQVARRAGGRDNITVVLVSAPEGSGQGTRQGRASGPGPQRRAWSLGVGVVAARLLG